MHSLDLITQQRQKEGKFLKIFLLSSLLASLAFHAGALTLQVGNLWSPAPNLEEEEEEVELLVTEDTPEEVVKEELLEPPPPEPEIPQEVAFAPDLPPPPIPLAPDSQAPLTPGEDAPSKEPPSPKNDPVTPLTSSTGDTAIPKGGGGPITKPDGKGSGFGNAAQPSGFVPNGKPDGKPDGKSGGTADGKPGNESGKTAVRTAPPSPQPGRSPQLVCLSCPKPKYQGKEASPRVDLKVRPDGTVEVRLRKSSGNPDLDRETLETMSKWRFDPKTVPADGVRKRVRVTYEEEGSQFQRQNETRRRQETEQRQERDRQRVAEEEQRQAPTGQATGGQVTERPQAPATVQPDASEKSTPVAPVRNAEPPVNSAPEVTAPAAAPAPAPAYEPPPAPAYEPPPAPAYEPPPAPVYEPAPAPVYEPPPAPVYEAPPPAVEAPPPEASGN